MDNLRVQAAPGAKATGELTSMICTMSHCGRGLWQAEVSQLLLLLLLLMVIR
jgi:hypothetical protein